MISGFMAARFYYGPDWTIYIRVIVPQLLKVAVYHIVKTIKPHFSAIITKPAKYVFDYKFFPRLLIIEPNGTIYTRVTVPLVK